MRPYMNTDKHRWLFEIGKTISPGCNLCSAGFICGSIGSKSEDFQPELQVEGYAQEDDEPHPVVIEKGLETALAGTALDQSVLAIHEPRNDRQCDIVENAQILRVADENHRRE